MYRLTKRMDYGIIDPPWGLCCESEENQWNEDCREKLAHYEDLEDENKIPKELRYDCRK